MVIPRLGSRWIFAVCKSFIKLQIRMFWILLVTSNYATSAFAEAQVMEWKELVDKDAQVFDDPYRELEPEQLAKLITIARLRLQTEKGESIDEETLIRYTASLITDGVDIDGILAQRWAVAEKREQAATSGNKAADGREVLLTGFVIPAPPEADGIATAYLVPERGMCSHMPPPAPNQMVRLRLLTDWKPQIIYEPVRLTGKLTIAPSSRTVRVMDGLVPMRATYSMDVSEIQSFGPPYIGDASQR